MNPYVSLDWGEYSEIWKTVGDWYGIIIITIIIIIIINFILIWHK